MAIEGELGKSVRLVIRGFENPQGTESVLSFGGGSTFATLPLEPYESLEQRHTRASQNVQQLFEAARNWDEATEICAAQDVLEALKQPLLDELARQGAVDPVLVSPDCPFCQARDEQGSPEADSN
jgi:hypothetical protein